jgi:hypothetical protein
LEKKEIFMKIIRSMLVACGILICSPAMMALETGMAAETKEPVGENAAKAPVALPGNARKDKPAKVKAPAPGEIKPLPGGKTIAEIYAEPGEMKDQVVSLNAKVIRFKSKLMGKNWIALQDGTGSKPDNKIVATSQEVVKPGDLVIVKGTLATNVDLGRGYSYKVMLEEATFSPGLE